jgi:oligoendopeptidase F
VEEPALAEYRHYLERSLRVAPHLLGEAEERIIMAKDKTGVNAWSKLQSKWLSSRQFRPVVRGKESVLTMGELVPLIYSPDRETRRAAYLAMGTELGKDQLLWTDALRTIWTDHMQMCKLRKYPSPLTSSLIANDVEEDAIHALMRVVVANAPLVQRYFRLKAKLLGLEKLGNWDLRAPLPDAPEISWTWDEGKELMRVRAQAAAVERSEYSCLAGDLGMIHRCIRLMAIQMKHPAAEQVKAGEGVEIIVVTTPDDGPLAIVRHDE